MSFRGRLIVFFVLIVVVPTAAIAVLVLNVTEDSRSGKADAQLSTGLQTGLSLYGDELAAAKQSGSELAREPAFGDAVAAGDVDALADAAAQSPEAKGAAYLTVSLDGTRKTVTGARDPIAVADVGGGLGGHDFDVRISTIGPSEYANDVNARTGLDAAVVGENGVSAATLPPGDTELPDGGDSASLDSGDDTLRAGAADLPASGGQRLVLFAPMESGGFLESSPGVAAALVAFLLIAVAFIVFLVRTLQGQIASMLDAARRIGSGDFTRKVPVVGNDEMAGLATEFNRMSYQLVLQMDQLRSQRDELDRSIERLGDAFAAGLDREAVLRIVLETAIGACSAEYGRVTLADGSVVEEPEGTRSSARAAATAGEKRSNRDGVPVKARREDGYALSAPLRRLGGDQPVGTMSVARRGADFAMEEQRMLTYLIGQASASLENISAHERVSELAVTDELTGLANNRAFRETIDREAARAERFGHELSLIMLDLDDFKLINDTHGHQQGDEVLRAIGRVLDNESREIDEPARYGGEEFVVLLPETPLEGALEVAERIRATIEVEPIEMLDGSGPMYISASFGAAELPASAKSVHELIEAADKALYAAKREGKNRICVAGQTGASAQRQ